MRTEVVVLPSSPSIAEIARRCRQMMRRLALVSAGATLVPIPGLDIATDVGLLMRLITEVNQEFGLSPHQIRRLESQTQVRLYQAMVAFGGAMIGKVITTDLVMRALCAMGTRITLKQAARYVPIAGQAVSAAMSYGAMCYVGERHIRDCVRVLEQVTMLEDPTVPIEGVAQWIEIHS